MPVADDSPRPLRARALHHLREPVAPAQRSRCDGRTALRSL